MAAAGAGVGDIVHLSGNFEDGAVDVAGVVVVDEQEIGWAVPVTCTSFRGSCSN